MTFSPSLIKEELYALKDEKNALFQIKLTPGVDPATFLGCRVPALRALAKRILKEGDYDTFLKTLPHDLYDENMLHALLLSGIKDYDSCLEEVERFLPFVDNWSVCDVLSPAVFGKNRKKLKTKIRKWIASSRPYTCRFGIEMAMTHFLGEDLDQKMMEQIASISLDHYYVNMMIAWYFATALAKNRDEAIVYLEERRFSYFVHHKTIQKAVESYRISYEDKELLKTMRYREKKHECQ